MENTLQLITYLASFIIVALAANQIGKFAIRAKLPLITGFLFSGIIVGPYVLNLIPAGASDYLRVVDEVALAFIAFAAGSELYLDELKDRFKSIGWTTVGLVVSIFSLGTLTFILLSSQIPFMQDMPIKSIIGISLIGGSILMAISPSSAIAIVNELRAKGPFTRLVLGVTIIMDVVVILLFAFSTSVADALLNSFGFNLSFVALMLFELAMSLFFGFLVYKLIVFILHQKFSIDIKMILVLLSGYGIFIVANFIRETSHQQLPFEMILEPLMVAMVAGFLVSSFSDYQEDFHRILRKAGPSIYVMFFTLTGVSLALDILVKTWVVALALFGIRFIGIIIGTVGGGTIAREPRKQNQVAWMAFITQAGVGLGLSKEVAVQFPAWGEEFATIIISVIVLNQIVGPPLFKNVLFKMKEAYPKKDTPEHDGDRNVFIFGLKAQSLMLAKKLQKHGWTTKIICGDPNRDTNLVTNDVNTCLVEEIDFDTLREEGIDKADVAVFFISDQKAYELCEHLYENYGTETMVVRIKDRANIEKFQKLGVKVVEPQTATVNLLEHFVLSPSGTSILLDAEDDQEMIDIEIRNPNIDGMALKDTRIPIDVLVLSVFRDGHTVLPKGRLVFKLGDKVTMMGPYEELEKIELRFGG